MALVAMLMVSTSCGTEQKCIDLIPADAEHIVALSPEAIITKAGLHDAENKALKANLVEAAQSGLKPASAQLVGKVLDNPSESGIDMAARVYIFTSEIVGGTVLVAGVSDIKKLQNTLAVLADEQLAKPVNQADGYGYTLVGEDVLVAFSKQAVVVTDLSYGSPQETAALFFDKSVADASKQRPAVLADLERASGDVVFATNPGKLFHLTTGLGYMLRGTPLNDLRLTGALNFEKGRATLQLTPHAETPEMKAYLEMQQKITRKLQSGLLSQLPAGALAYAAAGIDGPAQYEVLTQEASKANATAADYEWAKELLNALNGDVAVAVTDVSLFGMPGVVVLAEAKSGEPLANLYARRAELGMNNRFTQTATDEYKCRINNKTLYLGYRDKMIYVTTTESLSKQVGSKPAESLKNAAYAKHVKGNHMYFVIDAQALLGNKTLKGLAAMGGPQVAAVMNVLGQVDYLEMTSANDNTCEVNLYTTDEKTNVLKQFVNYGKQLLGY